MKRALLPLALALGPGGLALALQGEPAKVSFHTQVAPLLSERCAGCHQPGKSKGKLDLTSYATLLAGGKSGASLLAGKPEESLLIELVRPNDGQPPEMPEEGQPLDEAQVALLVRWIAEGALDDTPAATGPLYDRAHPPHYERPPVVSAIDYSPDGKWLALSGFHEVLLYDRASGTMAERLIGDSSRIESIAFSPDGSRLAVSAGTPGRSGELQIWRPATAALERTLSPTHDSLFGASWSPDGRLIAFGCTDKSLRAVEADSGKEVLYQGAHDDWVLGTTFSSDGSHLLSVGRDRSMKLTQVATQQFIDNVTSITPGALKGGLMAIERRPGTDEVLAAGADGTPRTYRIYREKKRVIGDDYNLILSYEPMPGRVFSLAWAADGEHFLAGSSGDGSGQLALYQVGQAAPAWRASLASGVYAVSLSPDGKQAAAGTYAGLVCLYDAVSGTKSGEIRALPSEMEVER